MRQEIFLRLWWRKLAAGQRLQHASYRGSWGERCGPRSVTAIYSVAVDRTPNFPIKRRTLHHWSITATPKCSSCLGVNCQLSGDVVMCRWGVTEEPTIGETVLSWLWLFTGSSCNAFYIRLWEERKYKLRNTRALMFASLQSHGISLFKWLWLRWWKWLCLERKVKGWGTIAPQVSVLKNHWFQGKHWGTLAHWIWPRLLSEHFVNLLTPQPHVVFFKRAYQSRTSKRKYCKELELLKINF